MKDLLLFIINIYRRYLSPLKRTPCCRFYPTCSEYAYTAIKEWGVIVGLFLGAWRILRCNPLIRGGVDHVPLRGSKKRSVGGYTVFYSRSPYSRFCGYKSSKNTAEDDGVNDNAVIADKSDKDDEGI